MKVYEKPRIRIETFNLNKHIAACAFDYNNQSDKNVCYAIGDSAYNQGGITVFSSTNENCAWNEEQSQFYCYTNGVIGMNIHNS